MNLTKWFNGKFLIQNLKKSKGLLILLILVLPILTTLQLIAQNSEQYVTVIESNNLAIINIFGMYIIPFIISVILAGYIYKKNSVDFINSMPMNRQTIYVTNFIGGVIVILATQILTMLLSFVCSSMLPNLFIAKAMIVDMFFVMLISYIFVYSVCMLAQTVSGNVLTQIVVVALILFLVPFIHFAFTNVATYEYPVWEINYDGGVTRIDEQINTTYTMPFNLIFGVMFSGSEIYSELSMAKMVILTVLYLALGIYLFKKRKMENVGTSFVTMKAHFIVKGLTLVPFVFLCNMAKLSNIYVGIVISILAIYYIIYDFIVSKKVKFKYTVAGFIVSVVAIFLVYRGGLYIAQKTENKSISVNDIVGISMTNAFTGRSLEYCRVLDNYVTDTAIINETVKNIYNNNDFWNMENFEERLENEYCNYIGTRIKLKNGKEINTIINIKKNAYEAFEKAMSELPGYDDSFKMNEVAILRNEFLSEEDTLIVKKALEEKHYDINKGLYTLRDNRLSLYAYDNHSMKKMEVDIGLTKEIFERCTKQFNDRAKRIMQDYDKEEDYYNVHVTKVTLKTGGISENNIDDVSIGMTEELRQYIINHAGDICDPSKEFYYIDMYGNQGFTFFINSNSEINEIIKKYMEKNDIKWNSEYDEMMDDYYKDYHGEDSVVTQ